MSRLGIENKKFALQNVNLRIQGENRGIFEKPERAKPP